MIVLEIDDVCPYCKGRISQIMMEENEKPEPGMILICEFCGEVMILSDEMKFIKPTPEQLIMILENDPELNIIQEDIVRGYSGGTRRFT